jgi:gas vesicle protein
MAREGRGFGKFIAGAAIGVGLGVLFAPKSGEETRKELKAKFDELVQKVKELDMNEVRDSFLKKIDNIKAELADLDKEKVLEIAKEKAEAIKMKLDELVTEAKEKATPVIQKSVSGLRDKTIEVLKNTTKKLEVAKKEEKQAKIENVKKEK